MRPANTRTDSLILIAFGLSVIITGVLTALAVYAFVVPKQEEKTHTLASYEHIGSYTYTVSTAPSALNPATVIGPVQPSTSEANPAAVASPIFTNLANTIDFTYNYKLRNGTPNVSGSIAADLVLKDGENWTQTMALVPAQTFDGTEASISGVLDLKYIGSLLKQLGDQTGARAGALELTIVPTVSLQGVVAGQQIDETYSTSLAFTYTATQIKPAEVLAFSEPRAITELLRQENTMPGSSMGVEPARVAFGVLSAISLGVAGLLAGVAFLGLGRGPEAKVRARYRSLLVPVSEVESTSGHRIVVASVDDLAKLAKGDSRNIFVRSFDDGSLAYFVHDGAVIYQFGVGNVPEGWVKRPQSQAIEPVAVKANAPHDDLPEIPAWLTAPYEYEDDENDADQEAGLAQETAEKNGSSPSAPSGGAEDPAGWPGLSSSGQTRDDSASRSGDLAPRRAHGLSGSSMRPWLRKRSIASRPDNPLRVSETGGRASRNGGYDDSPVVQTLEAQAPETSEADTEPASKSGGQEQTPKIDDQALPVPHSPGVSVSRRAREVPLGRRVTDSARQWLRDFLEYQPDDDAE